MLPSWQLALSSLAGRRGRTILLTGAVAAACALIVAVSSGLTSAQATMEQVLTQLLGSADARIIHVFNGRFDRSLLEDVRKWPGVTDVTTQLNGSVTLIRADKRVDDETGDVLRAAPQAFGIEFDLYEEFRTTEVRVGRLPRQSHEILIDPATALLLDAKPGDVLHIERRTDPIALTVTGIYERPQFGSLQRPRLFMDRELLAEILRFDNQISTILIKLEPQINPEEFCTAFGDSLPKTLTLEPAELAKAGFDRRVEASRFGLIVSSVMTFMAASFIIITGLTTGVTERQREMAVMRCVGASRAQLFASQIFTGLLFAFGGACIGIPFGAGLAALLAIFFSDLLPAGFQISWLGVSLASIGALTAGTFGAIFPAWAASRTTPLSAMTTVAQPQRKRALVICTAIALALIATQITIMQFGDRDWRFWSYFYVGLPCIFIGYFLLGTPVLLLVTNTIGRALCTILKLPADVVTGSINRTRFRHGFTAGALMVGLTILVADWTSMNGLLDGWLNRIKFADAFAFRLTGLSPHERAAIENLPFVDATCPLTMITLKIEGEQVFGVDGMTPPYVNAFGFDPNVYFDLNAIVWVQGDPEVAIPRLKDGDTVLLAERFLTARGIGVGDSLTLGMGRLTHEYEVVGVVSSAGLEVAIQVFGVNNQYAEFALSGVFMDIDTLQQRYDKQDIVAMQIDLSDDISDDEAYNQFVEAVPGVPFFTGRWLINTINELAVALYSVDSAIAFMALLLTCIAMGNVIAAAIHGRRFEYGLLRAVGGHTHLLVRLIVVEVALLALTGAILGTALGLHIALIGARFYRELAGIDIPLLFPYVAVAIGWIITIALSIAVATPGLRMLRRTQPSALLAAGRND